MLTRKLKLTLKGLEVGTTPMLLPAISSRLNLPIQELLSQISDIVDGPFLISAYDYYYEKYLYKHDISVSFSDLIFLDSGGYECNKDLGISNIGLYKTNHLEWNKDFHLLTIKEWPNDVPTVLISYDHPLVRDTISRQIENANDLFHGKDEFLKEILIKPETDTSTKINPEKIIENLDLFTLFDIVGFTEKELGNSILERMVCIAKIRIAMDKKGIDIPIHIFGGLDVVTTPLYYLSGADIFDGLSWLRFLFNDGNTLYIDSFGPKFYGSDENIYKIWIRSIYQNYNYLRRLKSDLEIFHYKNDFKIFGPNAEFFKKAYEDLVVNVRVI